MRPHLRAVFAPALLLALPGIAFATIHSDPVRLRVVGPAPVFRPGEPATFRFEMVSRQDVTVSQVSVESASLSQPFARRAAMLRATATVPLQFDLSLLPSEQPEPLVIRYEVDGVPYERTIDLASRMESAVEERSRMVQVSADPPRAASARLLAEADSVRRAREAAGAGGTLIFYSGRLVYTRPGDGSVPAQEVGAMGVRASLMDEDTAFDDVLGMTFTDDDGYFYDYVYWDGQPLELEGDPELFIRFETDHPWVVVQEGFWDIRYSWDTSARGSSIADVHVGTFRPSDFSTHPALHIATNIAKTHRWFEDRAGYDLHGLAVYWPDGNNASYDPLWQEIHISNARQWEEKVAAHEFGHFFVDEFAADESPSYCNGICDNDGCGHCVWCEEGMNEAFSEGWADWASALATRSFADYGGFSALYQYNFEKLANCSGTFQDASRVEGNFAAILWDIYDGDAGADDTDPNGYGWRDRLGLGFGEIFQVLDLDEPTNSRDFMTAFVNRFGQHRSSLWEVGMNNRWDLDVQAPGAVTNLASSTHPAGVATPNLNVTLSWTQPPPDEWSGIKGYSVAFGSSPVAPDAILETGVSSGYTSPDLAPGTYYVTVCAVDRSNRISATYPTYGPFTIQQPTPVDIAPYTAPGWARPLVARATGDATATSVPNPPAQLAGNTAPTYFNVSGRNQGQSAHVGIIGIRTRIFADAVAFHTTGYVHPDNPGATFNHVNRAGTIRGGRHMIGTILDGFNEWWESSEVNNYWSHAWVWSPLSLTANAAVRRMQPPPNPTGSWSGVFDGSPTYYNCDGFRIASSGWWNAVWVAADADTDDYDIRLHPASSSPDAGFDTVYGWGSEPEGYLDAVLANRNTMGSVNLDIGVINDLDAGQDFVMQSPFVIKHVTSSGFDFADSAGVTFPDSELVVLKEVYVPAAGPVSVTVWADSSGGPVRVEWLDRLFTGGTLSSAQWTWPAGKVSFDVTASAPGYHCVALYRDPRDGRGARACSLGVGPTPGDVAPVTLAGWHGPIVPRPTTDGTPLAVPAPDTLHGGVATTYLNLAWRNESPGSMPAGTFEVEAQVDGVPAVFAWVPTLAAYQNGTITGTGSPPLDVRGGRHMLSASYDENLLVTEKSDENNGWGEQWAWSPLVLALGSGVTSPAPPDPVGGFARYSGVGPLFYNCAGFRATFAAGTGLWGGVGLIPADSTDSDLRLHDPVRGARDAFGVALGHSSWGRYDSDYLIVRHDAPRVLDASVIQGDDGSAGEFDISADGSTALAALPLATTDQLMGTSNIVRLHPVVLPAGDVRVRLLNVSGSVDWGVSLHDDSTSVQGKSDALAAAWLAAPGADEELLVHLDSPDTFAVAVWKHGADDRGQFGVYRLQVDAVTLDAPPDEPPLATRLAPARPSPFRGRTALSFDLASPGEAKLEVFDLRGARVRTLAQGVHAAGRHTVEWLGDDESGTRLAPGLYLVRLEAGRVRAQAKVVKIE